MQFVLDAIGLYQSLSNSLTWSVCMVFLDFFYIACWSTFLVFDVILSNSLHT